MNLTETQSLSLVRLEACFGHIYLGDLYLLATLCFAVGRWDLALKCLASLVNFILQAGNCPFDSSC